MKFKTNIKCDGCIATVTPVLDQAVGAGNWQVDLNDPMRILTLPDGIDLPKVQSDLKGVGYRMEPV